MKIKGIYFDFGFTLAFPEREMEWEYYYFNRDALADILSDRALAPLLKIKDPRSLHDFVRKDLVDVYDAHEKSDFIDPRSFLLLKEKSELVFRLPPDDGHITAFFRHLNTMGYFIISDKTKDLLRGLSKRVSLSLISNMFLPGGFLLEKLEQEGVRDLFSTVTVSSLCGYTKPHPRIFLDTLKKDGLRPGEALFVGDSYPNDIIGAKKAGLMTCFFNPKKEKVAEKYHDFMIGGLEEIREII